MTRLIRLLFTMVPVVALVVALISVELPVFSLSPGEARDVLPRIEIRGVRTYSPRGRLLMTSIRLRRLTAFDLVSAWLDDSRDVVPERDVIERGETDREHRRESDTQMDGSQIAAAAAAFRRTTRYPARHGEGVLVQEVFHGSPADGRLLPGERIVSIAGREVENLASARRLLARTGLRAFRAEVEGEGGRRTEVLRRARVAGRRTPVLGVALVDSFPFGVRVDSEDVGGPSGGLIFALAMIDLLDPGDLTAGRVIAGTGALSLDEEVVGVGGVDLKVRAAEEAGADVFLVPRDNAREARSARTRIPVVAVASLDEAVRYLSAGRP